MKLFPHSLLRIAGNTYDELEELEVDDCILENYLSEKGRFKDLKKKIDSELYNLIGSLDDRNKQNLMLNLKRDIYNDRNISDEDIEQVFEITNEDLKELIQYYFSFSQKLVAIKKDCEEKFSEEIKKDREHFKKLIQGENFRKGLLLSSKSLLEVLDSYSLKNSVEEFSRNDFKAEQSAVQYITRLRTKTSPFSTFTNLSIAKLNNNSEKIAFGEEDRSIYCHVRLNNYLFKYLKDVMFSNLEIYRNFLVRPNPTIREQDEVFVYLTNNNNVESFQRIEINPLLSLLIEKLSAKKKGIRFSCIIELLTEYVEATQEDLQNYVNELIKYGFLEFNLGVSGIDTEWDVKLRSKLKQLEESGISLISELRDTLLTLRELAQEYEKESVSGRNKILNEAFEEFKAIALKLHKAAGLPEEERMSPKELRAFRKKQAEDNEGKDTDGNTEETRDDEETPFKHKSNTYFHFKPKNIFYEDSTLNISTEISEEGLTNFITHLNTLLRSLNFSKGKLDEQNKMAHFFKENYNDNKLVDLFSFYEDYYREIKKPEAEQKKKRLRNDGDENERDGKKEEKNEDDQADNIESIQNRKDLLENWIESFIEALKESSAGDSLDTINISQKQIDEVNDVLNISPRENSPNSLGTFVQFIAESSKNGKSKMRGVVNSTLGGFGKMISRFLHLFDDEVKDDLKNWNTSLVDGELLLENTDASYFNANLHPPLMPHEVWIPGGHNSLDEDRQIPVTELAVSLSEKENELELIYKPEDKKAYIFDLGFQGIKGRSQLFQMLSNFTLMDYLFYHPVTTAVNKWVGPDKNKEEGERNKILVHPRIEYEKTIILQRKNWNVPNFLLPQKMGNESDWDYFVKVHEWTKEHNIPTEVFVYVINRYSNAKIPQKKRRKLSRDDYKPQYINFNNPMLVQLFEKLVRKVPFSMKIEEMLPGSDQLFQIDGKRYVTEFVVQWYNFNEN